MHEPSGRALASLTDTRHSAPRRRALERVLFERTQRKRPKQRLGHGEAREQPLKEAPSHQRAGGANQRQHKRNNTRCSKQLQGDTHLRRRPSSLLAVPGLPSRSRFSPHSTASSSRRTCARRRGASAEGLKHEERTGKVLAAYGGQQQQPGLQLSARAVVQQRLVRTSASRWTSPVPSAVHACVTCAARPPASAAASAASAFSAASRASRLRVNSGSSR